MAQKEISSIAFTLRRQKYIHRFSGTLYVHRGSDYCGVYFTNIAADPNHVLRFTRFLKMMYFIFSEQPNLLKEIFMYAISNFNTRRKA